jgi:3,4-dihydroxy 2-butanone 4-phosphate synthase/GTP cyclohydrolase II
MTNNISKIVGLQGFGLEVTERLPIEVRPNGVNDFYLKTKQEKLNDVSSNGD